MATTHHSPRNDSTRSCVLHAEATFCLIFITFEITSLSLTTIDKLATMSLTNQQMIERAEDYYGLRTDHKTPDEIRDLIALGPAAGDPLPPHAWAYGSAAEAGLCYLLINPNRYPVHQDTEAIRYKIALLQFDFTQSLTDNTQTWKSQKDLVIRYFHHIYDLVPEDPINHNIYIGCGHAKLDSKYAYYKNMLACLLIHQVAYGFGTSRYQQGRLSNLGKLDENKWVHNMLVRPLVWYLLTEMNPHNELRYETIMTSDCGKQQEHIIRTGVKHGIWSSTVVLPLTQHPADHPRALTEEHKDMCKGIPYEFGRLCALLINNFKYGEDYKCSWTEDERRQLYAPLDNKYCIPRFPPIGDRGKTYGRF